MARESMISDMRLPMIKFGSVMTSTELLVQCMPLKKWQKKLFMQNLKRFFCIAETATRFP